MTNTCRLRSLPILADLWGRLLLFHPAVLSGATPGWEQVLLAAIPAVEQASDAAGLVACLNEFLFKPLGDPHSGAQLGRSAIRPQEPAASGRAPEICCVHEGWNEHGRPYIYGRRWEAVGSLAGQETACHFSYPEGVSVHLQLDWSPSQPEPPLHYPLPPPVSDRSLTRTERLLGLFKTWTILKYFFPLPGPAGDRWEGAAEFLTPWIPAIEAAESLEVFYRQMNALAATLQDGHALAWHPVLAADKTAGPPEDNDVRLNPSTSPVKGDPFRWPEAVKHLRQLEGNIAYMTPFSMPDTQTLLEAFELIRPADGLILDLRGYPKTHFQQALIRCLCRERVFSPRYELPVVFHPDPTRRQWRLIQYTVEPDPARPVFDKPVVALVDAETRSSAEDFAMYLKNAGRAVFVGAPTPGIAGNRTAIALPGGGRFFFTGMRVTWPDGRPFQGVGLRPDVEVLPASPGQERDEILEKGLAVLLALIGSRHD